MENTWAVAKPLDGSGADCQPGFDPPRVTGVSARALEQLREAEQEMAGMTFHSILFDKDGIQKEMAEQPAFLTDLNLDQVIDAITVPKRQYNLKPFFYTPLRDVETIRYRQEVMRDMEDETLMAHIKAFADKMTIMRSYLALAEQLDFNYHKKGWFLEAALVYCDAVSDLARNLRGCEEMPSPAMGEGEGEQPQADIFPRSSSANSGQRRTLSHSFDSAQDRQDREGENPRPLSLANLKSRGFLAFREYVMRYVHSYEFQSLLAEAQKVKSGLSSVKNCVIIQSGKFKVQRYEGETDYSVEVEKTFEKFKQGAVTDYRLDLDKRSGMNHIEAKILEFVSRLYPEKFAALERFCTNHSQFVNETIRIFDLEIQFYVAYLEFIAAIRRKRLTFCYPIVSTTSYEVYDYDAFDLALAHTLVDTNKPVVSNDFFLEGPERIIVVSGPNQGGKTTFARMFGQLHYLASLGCPVPGREARLFLFDQIFTHFEREEDIRNLRGKLQDDLVRIHENLARATQDSILIINEIFASSALQDAIFLSKEIMTRVIGLGLLCVWVTFIDELSSLNEKTVSMVSTVVPEDPAIRTFKIVRKPADGLAYALSIAQKHRLTYEQIKERIKP